ncbi:nucleotidyltransferase family protein [Deinococcus sp. KSM4-11]|uniref:nucleotidyltransferase family protein n=1 Tax=Deinococcus sp. KSM4-11 TaxID=2568654 RepID=UPI0010A55299|nr:nucleotidyltransferase family protein [Deinococcus sp. KSM4-11]THF88656.1 nucleotidyltransferase family protein [Deinococcus sp. KSM4-11]
MTEAEFLNTVRENAVVAALLERLGSLGTDQTYLVAGALFQTVWNVRSGQPPGKQILDYDLFNWDEELSFEAEDRVIRRAARLFADLGVQVEVRNQARVHMWFPERTGLTRPALTSVRDGIDQFLVTCTCVGIDESGAVYAPCGLADLAAGRLRLNTRNHTTELFTAKVQSYVARWPWLQVEGAPSLPL